MIAVLVGTRPELIKMAPVLKRLVEKQISFIFIHSGQHSSIQMDQKIMKDLELPKPDYNLHVGSGTHAVQTGRIMERVEEIFLHKSPRVVVVHGDTNTTLAGALTAKKLHIRVAHVEAGLRSFDYKMPEEVNRILVDRISDILFAPTEEARENLLKEGIDDKLIIVTGNTVVDSLKDHVKLAQNSRILKKLKLEKDEYILVTAHRPENVDNKGRFKNLLDLLDDASKLLKRKVIWSIHPRSKKQLDNFRLKIPDSIILIEPVGYIDMLCLIVNAHFIFTDSGGIQEEAYIFKKPLITLRNSTERPETLSANFIVDLDKDKLKQAIESFQNKKVSWNEHIFGDGNASKIIVSTLERILK